MTAAAGTGGLSDPAAAIPILFWGFVLIISVPVIAFVAFTILKKAKAKREKGIIDEMMNRAARAEAAGSFVSAGSIFEELKNYERAAQLYARGGDFARAALLYESIGQPENARAMYEQGGEPAKAAKCCVALRDFLGAARIYDSIGEKTKAGRAFEMAGNKMAAVRAYREGKDYERAALLLGEQGLFNEAVEMYRFSLSDKPDNSGIDRYTRYAALLERAGQPENACEVYRQILSVSPGHANSTARLAALGAPDDGSSSPAARETTSDRRAVQQTTLRNLINAGKMEPRHALRLWVQILKALKKEQESPSGLHNLSPESILISADNTIAFDRAAQKVFAYTPPEVLRGDAPDAKASLYTAGLILYEMLTGSLDSFGLKTPAEVAREIPSWLEGLTMKCIEKDRSKRYQDIDEIFSALKSLKTTR